MSNAHIEAQEGQAGFTFDWVSRTKKPLWLMVFVFLSLVAHAVCFYLFSLVEPLQARAPTKPLELTVLDLSDSDAQIFLKHIEDRVIALDLRESSVLLGQDLSESAVRFQPLFENYETRLKELPALDSEEVGQLFSAGSLYLPPTDENKNLPNEPSVSLSIDPVIEVFWEKDQRKVIRQFQWNPSSLVKRPGEVDRLIIHIGVDRYGSVVHLLPEQSVGKEMDTALIESLRAMRFSATEAEKITWAEVVVRW